MSSTGTKIAKSGPSECGDGCTPVRDPSVSDLSKGLQDEKAEVPCPVVGLKLVGCLGQPQGAQMPQAGWHTTV